jgi:site-specific DNA recombinase
MGYPPCMRVLGRLRLSRSTEESTSIERQREIIGQWVESNGHTLVGWAEDLDVSGSVDPFDTPQLGEWLNSRAPEFDILCSWKLDRLGRNAIQLNKLFGWCLDHGKTVVSCSESIDLSTPVGRLIANVIAFLAEGELEAIRERVKGSKRKLRELGRWSGGKPPYGYTAVKTDDGYRLAIDPIASEVVRRIVDDLLDGSPLTRIARELTSAGVPTPADYYRAQKGSQGAIRTFPQDAGSWSSTPIRNMLRSKALRGYAHHNGETVRDDDGMPIQLAEPLVTLDEWELIQAALDRVQESRRGIRRAEASPLAGVAVCIKCGLTLHHERNTVKRGEHEYVYRYYRCQNRDTVMIPAEHLEKLAQGVFLSEVGQLEVRERVWVPGDSREAELREAVTAFDELTKAAGRAKSATAKQRLQKQLDALDGKIAELESAPKREARWEYRPTGATYRSVWEVSDTDQRRELLRKSGITIAAGISGVVGKRSPSNAGVLHVEVQIPDQVKDMGAGPVGMWRSVLDVVRDADHVAGVHIGVDGDIRVFSTEGDVFPQE